MEEKKRRPIPKEHPPAWKSVLWEHEKLIRSMSHQRYSWPQIAAHLKSEFDITISHQSVRNFLVRADKSKRLGRRPYAWKQADKSQPQSNETEPFPKVETEPDTPKKTRPLHEPEPLPKHDPYAP